MKHTTIAVDIAKSLNLGFWLLRLRYRWAELVCGNGTSSSHRARRRGWNGHRVRRRARTLEARHGGEDRIGILVGGKRRPILARCALQVI